jgi:hypothetical protein
VEVSLLTWLDPQGRVLGLCFQVREICISNSAVRFRNQIPMRYIRGMFFFVIVALSTYMVDPMAANVNRELSYLEYRVHRCVPRDNGVSFWFTTKDKRSRHFALSNLERKIYLSFSGGKGDVDWNSVKKITFLKLGENEGYVSLVFKEERNFLSKEKFTSLEFGVMEKKCWHVLIENLSGQIAIEVIEQKR